jgi:uncharacterized protein YdeI (YjbR/CyaY-like superfamily)
MKNFKTAEEYFRSETRWKPELAKLRKIMLATGMQETVKWGGPVYTSQGKNICGIGAFNDWATIWFFQGALLSDPLGVLVNAQEGRTKALRQWRFTSASQVKAGEIKRYLEEAISHAQAGKEIKPDRDKPLIVPAELAAALKKNKTAGKAFAAMSKSCRREYAEYIAEAKKPETRMRRLDKAMSMITAGIGLNDKYR